MSKRKGTANPLSTPPDAKMHLTVDARTGEAKAATLATTALRPTVQAAITATALLEPQFKTDLNELINALSGQLKAAHDGDLSRTEAMMVTQAQTLDLLFNKLTRQAVLNIGQYSDAAELYMRLALRAQSQCRAVAELLHEMKNPRPVAFFQQANIANGPQQVNNGNPSPPPTSRAGETQNQPNELLEDVSHGNQMDLRAPQSATPSDTQMATLGEIDGATVRGRQKKFEP